MASECYDLGASKKLQCRHYFLNEIGMFYEQSSFVADIGAFVIALFSIPLIISALFCNFIFLFVLIFVNSRGGFFRDFGLAYVVFVLFSLLTDNICGSFLVRGLPWLEVPSIEVAMLGHVYCKYFYFLSTYLSASRINLLVAHCLIHVFSVELRTERKNMTLTIVALNMLCTFIGASMAVFTPIVYGVWVVGNHLVCLPDPEWPRIFVIFYLTHKVLFCDGLIQSIIIFVACFHLRRLYFRLGARVRCLIFNTDSNFLLYGSFKHLRERALSTQECLRVVYVHACFIALIRVAQSVNTLLSSQTIYNPRLVEISESEILSKILSYLVACDCIGLCELMGNLLHVWIAFFWQTSIRNTCLIFFVNLFQPFKRFKQWIYAHFYTDPATAARGADRGRISAIFNKNFLKYSTIVAARLTNENLKEAVKWLLTVPHLPTEVEEFIEESEVVKIM